MRILWITAAILGVSIADLPSCERARCGHCDVEFIARMCEKTCNACPRTVVDVRTGNRMKVYTEENRSPFSATLPKLGKNSEKQDNVQLKNPARQAGVATQTHQQIPYFNAPSNQLPRAIQLAAPQSQVAPAQYPPAGASTLAPLISPPRPIDISSNLAQQPADLAQPLPEYQQSGVQNAAAYQPQATQFQPAAPAQQQQFYGANANTAQQPTMTDIFGRPLFPAQAGQNPFQLPQQSQSTPLLNPFQPFMQQAGGAGAQSVLDPFGLFSLAGMGNLAQGTALTQVSPTATAYNAQQNAYRPTPPAGQQSQPSPQQNQQALPAPYYSQPQQNANVQQNVPHQQVNNYQGQQQQQYQAYQNPQNAYGLQNAQQQNLPQQANGINQHYQTNQAQVPQQYAQNQVAAAPPISQSIDSVPINVYKYVDGKGPAPSSLPQQCPRQPGWAPCISKQTANQRFGNCCARLGEGCTPLCNYDAPLSTMQLAVLTGRCPLNKMADIMVCASGYEDATACCEAYNVFEPGYEHCRPYCNPAAGLPQGGLLSEKYKCLVKLSAIQQCFYVSQKP